MTILTFTKNGSKAPAFPNRQGLSFRHIKFETNILEDLLLIAKYRIINFPTSLIIDNAGNVLLKVKGAISNKYVDSIAG